MHSVSTVQCELVCFSGGHFADPVASVTFKRMAPLESTNWVDKTETATIASWMSPPHGRYILPTPGGHSYSKESAHSTHPHIPCRPEISAHLKKLS